MAKRVPALTAVAFAKIKPDPTKTIELVDGAVAGLRLRVTPTGLKTWSLNIRANGVMRRFDVGKELGLADARKKAATLRQQINDGGDPTADRREQRSKAVSAKLGIGTFEAVIDGYFALGNGAGLKSKVEQARCIKLVLSAHLKRPAIDVVSSDLQRAVDAYTAKVTAARAVGYVKPLVKWALKRGLMQGVFDIEKPMQDAPKQRVLTEDDLASLLPTLTDPYGRCCRLILLTGVRLNEARNATWEQFDVANAIWTIPGEVRKDTRLQTKRRVTPKVAMPIPLSRQALLLLEEIRTAELSRRQLEGNGDDIAPGDMVFVGQKGGKLDNWDRWLKANFKKSGVDGWSAHALRRTTATLAGKTGAAPHVVSVILGHANLGGQLVAGYNKSRYETEHANILQDVADCIDQMYQPKQQATGAA
jgi:integrase